MEDPKISILVVEDSHTQALSLIHLLQQNGFNADLVENGVARPRKGRAFKTRRSNHRYLHGRDERL